jgi:hypothetical protein
VQSNHSLPREAWFASGTPFPSAREARGRPLPSQLDPGILLALAQVALAFPFFPTPTGHRRRLLFVAAGRGTSCSSRALPSLDPRPRQSSSSSPSPFACPSLARSYPSLSHSLPSGWSVVPTQTTTSPPSTLPDPLPETQSESQSQSQSSLSHSLILLTHTFPNSSSSFPSLPSSQPSTSSLQTSLSSPSRNPPSSKIQRLSCGRPFVGASHNCYSRHARSTIQPSLPPVVISDPNPLYHPSDDSLRSALIATISHRTIVARLPIWPCFAITLHPPSPRHHHLVANLHSCKTQRPRHPARHKPAQSLSCFCACFRPC